MRDCRGPDCQLPFLQAELRFKFNLYAAKHRSRTRPRSLLTTRPFGFAQFPALIFSVSLPYLISPSPLRLRSGTGPIVSSSHLPIVSTSPVAWSPPLSSELVIKTDSKKLLKLPFGFLGNHFSAVVLDRELDVVVVNHLRHNPGTDVPVHLHHQGLFPVNIEFLKGITVVVEISALVS